MYPGQAYSDRSRCCLAAPGNSAMHTGTCRDPASAGTDLRWWGRLKQRPAAFAGQKLPIAPLQMAPGFRKGLRQGNACKVKEHGQGHDEREKVVAEFSFCVP